MPNNFQLELIDYIENCRFVQKVFSVFSAATGTFEQEPILDGLFAITPNEEYSLHLKIYK